MSVGVDNVFEPNITREDVNLHLCICINCVGMGAKMLCFLTRQEQKKMLLREMHKGSTFT